MDSIKSMHEKMVDLETTFPVVNLPFSAIHVAIGLPQTVLSTLFAIIAEVGYAISKGGNKIAQKLFGPDDHPSPFAKTEYIFGSIKDSLWKDAKIGAIHTFGSAVNILSLGLLYSITPIGYSLSSDARPSY